MLDLLSKDTASSAPRIAFNRHLSPAQRELQRGHNDKQHLQGRGHYEEHVLLLLPRHRRGNRELQRNRVHAALQLHAGDIRQKTCLEQALLAIKAIDTGVAQLGPAVDRLALWDAPEEGRLSRLHVEAGWNLVLAIITKAIALGEIPAGRSAEEVTSSIYYIMRGVNLTWCMQGGNFDFPEKVQDELKIYFSMLQQVNS